MKSIGLANEVRALVSDAWAIRVVREFDRLKPLADEEHARKWGPPSDDQSALAQR